MRGSTQQIWALDNSKSCPILIQYPSYSETQALVDRLRVTFIPFSWNFILIIFCEPTQFFMFVNDWSPYSTLVWVTWHKPSGDRKLHLTETLRISTGESAVAEWFKILLLREEIYKNSNFLGMACSPMRKKSESHLSQLPADEKVIRGFERKYCLLPHNKLEVRNNNFGSGQPPLGELVAQSDGWNSTA